jgi:menaquinol-cytochrome c reductase iron-sulfur subunit
MASDSEIERRRFLTILTGAIAGVIGFFLAIPMAGYLLLPALRRREPEWLDAGTAESLPVLEPRQVEVVLSSVDGWLTTTRIKSLWAVKKESGEVTVYSPLCTHLGCGYRWESDPKRFFCPCHNSVFDIEGRVLAGPAPRPLDTLPVKLENGRLSVIYKEFKAGASKKIEL